MNPKAPLASFARNIESQNGEDGVLTEIFVRLGVTKGKCIEFGAWDGKYLSNTWNLWHNFGWDALLIEGDTTKASALLSATKHLPGVTVVASYIKPNGPQSLESILQSHEDFLESDLLSIDIDGDDYFIFESLRSFRPKVIIVEYNPTIPPNMNLVQQPGEYFGASALALLELAHQRKYYLATVTATNLIFVSDIHFAKLGFAEPSLSDIFDSSHLVYLMQAFDGRSLLSSIPPFTNQIAGFGYLKGLSFSIRGFIRTIIRGYKFPVASTTVKLRPHSERLVPVETFRSDE